KIVAREAYLAKDTDFKATLTKIKAAKPDVIFVPGNYQEAGMIVKQARELDLAQPIVGVDAWDSPKLFEIGGARALNNTYYPGHFSADDTSPAVQKFVKEYKDEYGIVPDTQAVLGYDSVFVLLDAIKRAGSDNPEKIRDALAATKDLRTVSGVITLDASHNPIKGAVINENKDGKVTFKERVDPKL
ncbi:MAG: ABC transporter substrate-binding protein, partial [Acidaminococcales bacterium]|nr:ABC transporter substrate-binding protein [Acidaminococcales bacterium]